MWTAIEHLVLVFLKAVAHRLGPRLVDLLLPPGRSHAHGRYAPGEPGIERMTIHVELELARAPSPPHATPAAVPLLAAAKPARRRPRKKRNRRA